MKKHVLIFLSSIVFACLFYKQLLGLNLSIFALMLALANYIQFPSMRRNKKANSLLILVIACALSNAWLLSFTTTFALITSLFVYRYYCINPTLNLFSHVLTHISSWFTFFISVFKIDTWMETKPKVKNEIMFKLLAYIALPFLVLIVFIPIYISSSDTLSNWYNTFEFELNVSFLGVLMLGFYISFLFWYDIIHPSFIHLSENLKNDFPNEAKDNPKATFSFLPIEFELRSGIITLMFLNLSLLLFLIVFNVEHFNRGVHASYSYSSHVHQQINSIIISIVLAMVVILFYFKKGLNFLKNNRLLTIGAKTWIILNAILVLSACYQNGLYVFALGLTYKRLGVFLFLFLCFLGLFFTYKKIHQKHTNFYLYHKMSWTFFYTLVFCALGNWGSWITSINIKMNKTDWPYLEYDIEGNERVLFSYYEKTNKPIPRAILNYVKNHQQRSLLSSQLFYRTIDLSRFEVEENKQTTLLHDVPTP